tara:strand:+ start:807 stop:1133 length:327 start_codon:yes stop_codon:yes gene_type:complete
MVVLVNYIIVAFIFILGWKYLNYIRDRHISKVLEMDEKFISNPVINITYNDYNTNKNILYQMYENLNHVDGIDGVEDVYELLKHELNELEYKPKQLIQKNDWKLIENG